MSDDGFHVHGAHEHLVHEAGHTPNRLAQFVAIFTALMATLGAVVSYQSSDTLSEAMLLKNEAVLRKAQATDQWDFYQSKSMKGHLTELAADLAPADKKAKLLDQMQRYNQEKAEIKSQAEALEKQSVAANAASALAMEPHHRQAQAMTLIQIAISLASVTALTGQVWLFAVAGVAATGGVGLWLWALLA